MLSARQNGRSDRRWLYAQLRRTPCQRDVEQHLQLTREADFYTVDQVDPTPNGEDLFRKLEPEGWR